MATVITPPAPEGPGRTDDPAGDGLMNATPGGLSWMWELDLDAVLEAVTGAAPWLRTTPGSEHTEADAAAGTPEKHEPDPEADDAKYQEAVAEGRVRTIPPELIAGRIAETLPTGPGLAAWLGQASAADLEDGALAGIAASFHRMAAWAAAGELAAIAQIASRSAKTDRRASTDHSGRPDRVTSDAAGQVGLALAISRDTAVNWTDLAVTLTWRLPLTLQALGTGQIDLTRARMIARMTGPLSDAAAREVEAAVLGRAGWLTPGQLHAALRRAVIKVDPDGAERRREEAERDATVALYPDEKGTATLAGYSLPCVQAAAAMARITAVARAMKAAGSDNKMDWLRAQAFLRLILGTLPPIPEQPGEPGGPSQPGGPDEPGGSPDPGGSGEPSGSGEPGGQGEPPSPPAPGDSPAPGDRPRQGGDPSVEGFSPAGLLNLTVPLATLAGTSAAPGQLTWVGLITASQTRRLGVLAAHHPATQWRIVIVNRSGHAIAVTHVPRSRSPGVSCADKAGIGLIRRVTLVTSIRQLANAPPSLDSPTQIQNPVLAKILAKALVVANRAADEAADREANDERAGGCAHQLGSPAYRPPPRIAELVTARDQTCRFPPCRRPADMCDLDHTQPYDQGGPTCTCNIGGECRSHHQLKQHPRWSLSQSPAGEFRWTTPTGRTYISRPDPYTL